MQLILASIIPILLALLLGYCLGGLLPRQYTRHTARLLSPLIWLLLFFCGKEFGHVLSDSAVMGKTLITALVFAVLTTLLPWGLIALWRRSPALADTAGQPARLSGLHFFHALRDCLTALGMVAMGAIASRFDLIWLEPITASQWLYLLVVLVGVDLAGLKLGSAWRSSEVMLLPVLVIIGSMAGGVLAAVLTGEGLWTSLALSSGFGWVTLSSILVSSQLGSHYGALAMLTDLFRELMAISMLYLLGARFSREAIGICGATALDATLPLIRQRCGTGCVSLALISGFVLTLASPVLIMLSLAAG